MPKSPAKREARSSFLEPRGGRQVGEVIQSSWVGVPGCWCMRSQVLDSKRIPPATPASRVAAHPSRAGSRRQVWNSGAGPGISSRPSTSSGRAWYALRSRVGRKPAGGPRRGQQNAGADLRPTGLQVPRAPRASPSPSIPGRNSKRPGHRQVVGLRTRANRTANPRSSKPSIRACKAASATGSSRPPDQPPSPRATPTDPPAGRR